MRTLSLLLLILLCIQSFKLNSVLRNKLRSAKIIVHVGYSDYLDNSYSYPVSVDDFTTLLEAMRCYKDTYGDLSIHYRFKVPKKDPWPKSTRGFELGKRLSQLVTNDDFLKNYPQEILQLKQIGFDPYVTKLIDAWDVVFSALKTYKEIYGNLIIPTKFVVPSTEPWPRHTHGCPLGIRVSTIRSRGSYTLMHPERKNSLDDIGFIWSAKEYRKEKVKEKPKLDYDLIINALTAYKTIYGTIDVPQEFVIPCQPPWNEEFHNMSLGKDVETILFKGKTTIHNVDVLNRLEALDFPWYRSRTEQRYSRVFDLIVECLKTYKSLYGNLFIGQLFIVPSTPPWPEESWGMALGSRVSTIRNQKSYISNNPERK
jgi:hypothetical protein